MKMEFWYVTKAYECKTKTWAIICNLNWNLIFNKKKMNEIRKTFSMYLLLQIQIVQLESFEFRTKYELVGN